ncbi:MAG: ABC transporter ATP-binding protein [Chloroflexi bacterium]|nr:ABC transporter ATP-binding protein [Chloroflexota bacterium]
MTQSAQQSLITIDQVTKTYRLGKLDVQAVRGVSLSIRKGEMVAIVGASGSGKSSFMNILGCLDRPTSGKYYLDSHDVGKMNDNALANIRRDKIGFVFQQFNLLQRMSAIDNVALPLIYANGKARRARAVEALERVGLGKRGKHRPVELSGGEQQRVAIARALINKPSLVLADEPTGNLDSRVGAEILRLFQELHDKEGMTLVFVTHDPAVSAISPRVVTFKDGLIISDEVKGKAAV